MIKRTITTFYLVLNLVNVHAQETIHSGQWNGRFNIGKTLPISFEFNVKNVLKLIQIEVINGEEKVPMQPLEMNGDTCVVKFLYFPTELRFKINSPDSITGRWVNHLKSNYSVPFTAESKQQERSYFTDKKEAAINLTGKWNTSFYSHTEDQKTPAIGVFKQKKNKITGTFLTETGDYRYLAGNVYGNKMLLSAFDGSHIYQFEADYNTETKTLKGTFRSGNHFHNHFEAKLDPTVELQKADKITFVQDSKPLEFKMVNNTKDTLIYKREKHLNKVVLIQVLGTWCSNCVDETHFFKELQEKYGEKGLEIIGVAFELGTDVEKQLEQIETYRQKFELNYPIYLGGKANKKEAAEVFNNIFNGIFSFPTAILIDKTGNIVNIHTGFNGPGTGSYYTTYVKNTKKQIKRLLKQ